MYTFSRGVSRFKRQKEEKFHLFNVHTTKYPLIHHGHIPYLSLVKSLHIY